MEALKEALKEALRVIVLAIIPVALVSLENGNFVDWKLVYMAALIAFLRFVDKWLHEEGKDTKNPIMEGGITRF